MTARTLAPFDPKVVAPWTIGSGSRGVLLLHGFASTPPELRYIGDFLAANGWKCTAPALAGHASAPAELAKTNWEDWASTAREALFDLRKECDQVVVIGQSMGGTLALHLAAHDHEIASVVTLAAPVWIRNVVRRWLHPISKVYRWYYPKGESDLYRPDGVEELHSYGKRSMHAVAELFDLLDVVRDEVALVRAPVLVLHGGRDRVVDPRNADDIARRLISSGEVQTHIYPRSGHALSVDVDRDDINARVLAWFDRALPTPSSRPLAYRQVPAVPPSSDDG